MTVWVRSAHGAENLVLGSKIIIRDVIGVNKAAESRFGLLGAMNRRVIKAGISRKFFRTDQVRRVQRIHVFWLW